MVLRGAVNNRSILAVVRDGAREKVQTGVNIQRLLTKLD